MMPFKIKIIIWQGRQNIRVEPVSLPSHEKGGGFCSGLEIYPGKNSRGTETMHENGQHFSKPDNIFFKLRRYSKVHRGDTIKNLWTYTVDVALSSESPVCKRILHSIQCRHKHTLM